MLTRIPQACPIYFFLAQQGYLLVRSPRYGPQSGYNTIKWLYLALFMLASYTHIGTLVAHLGDLNSLRAFLLPPLSPTTEASNGVQAT